MKRKKIIALILAILLMSALMFQSSCSCSPDPEPTPKGETTKLGLVRTTAAVKNPTEDVNIQVISDGKVAAEDFGELTYGKAFIANSNDSITVKDNKKATNPNVKVGDIVRITADYQYIKVKLLGLEEQILFSPTGEFIYQIPSVGGTNVANWQDAYPSGMFTKTSNVIEASIPTADEIAAERNLALNPYDFATKNEMNVDTYNNKVGSGAAVDDKPLNSLPSDSISVENGDVVAFPHAYANRITVDTNRPSFMPKNAIDGETATGGNLGHIRYGATSWGGGKFTDLEYVVYFGREVTINKLNFVLRADYTQSPAHDTNWESLTVEFSNGSEEVIDNLKHGSLLAKPNDKQSYDITPVKTTSIRLKDFKVATVLTGAGWCALTEVEAIGTDANKNSAAMKTTTTNTWGGKKTVATTDEFSAWDMKEYIDFACSDAVDVVYKDNGSNGAQSWWRDTVLVSAMMDAYGTTGGIEQYLFVRNLADKYKYTLSSHENGRGNQFIALSSIIDDYDGPGEATDFADNYLIGESYMWLNDLKPAKHKTYVTIANADANMIDRPTWNTNFNWGGTLGRPGASNSANRPKAADVFDWWWCDALYMGLNGFTLMSSYTENDMYITKAFNSYQHWKAILRCDGTHTGHGDRDYGLWHRDTDTANFNTNNKLHSTGSNVPSFWGRGNAWVAAAIAKQLYYVDPALEVKNLDGDFVNVYDTYVEDLKTMAVTLKEFQRSDGSWDPSIIDPAYKPGKESTGTAGFVYALAVGVQLGILDKDEYMDVVINGFNSLLAMRLDSGRVGYMQNVGYDTLNYLGSEGTKNLTNPFGYGLYIHAAAAIMRMCKDYTPAIMEVPADAQYGVQNVPDYKGVKQ